MRDPEASDGWLIPFEGYDPADEGRREALCTLGNGYFATRGAAPESAADEVHYPGTYAAGCYNRLRDEIAGQVVENESLVNLPNWLDLRVAFDDGEWVDLAQVSVLAYRQVLDLERGMLTRSVRLRDGAGRGASVVQHRFVHMQLPHLAGLRTTITVDGWSGRLRIRSGIDGTVRNCGVQRYRALSGQHLTVVSAEEHGDAVLLVTETTQSKLRVAQAARTTVRAPGAEQRWWRRLVRTPGRIAHELDVEVRPGDRIVVDKVATLATSRDVAGCEPSLTALGWLAQAEAGGFAALLERHVLTWRHLWQRFRIIISEAAVPSDAETVRTLRLHIFHVLQTVSPNSLDVDAGIPARGLHGEAYRGHVFWDELFVFPLLTLRLPALARALLRYRSRRLPAARQAARAAGYAGAMYPWQSGSDGREESQRLHLNPMSGRWTADVSPLQRHVGIAVAYNVWQYFQATGNAAFLADHGAEVLLEIARFWASITSYDPARGRYVIRGVVGPDEYSTRYPGAAEPGIDNNAYTNVMAVWVLHRAAEVFDHLPAIRRVELIETLGLSAEERSHWAAITRGMFVPFHPDGVISQFEGYHELAELDWDGYRARYGDLQRLDRILEAEGRSVDDFQVSKQADVLMLFYLLSAEELGELLAGLGYPLERDTIPRTIEHYLARTAHGSTISALVHGWVLARGHRDRALEFFERALHSDIADIQGGTTAEGVHLAAMAGSVDLLQRCFAGLETREGVLWFNPHWPERFGLLEFALLYREQPLDVGISADRVQVHAAPGPGPGVLIGCRKEVRELRPGETATFDS